METTSKFQVENQAILANCNTVFNALCFNPWQQIAAYACANMVLIADVLGQRKCHFSLGGHQQRVNSV